MPALLAATGSTNQFSAAATGISARLREATPEPQSFMDTAATYAANTSHTLTETTLAAIASPLPAFPDPGIC